MPDWMKAKTQRHMARTRSEMLTDSLRRAETEPSKAEIRAMLAEAVRTTAELPIQEDGS